ncbi:MAG TPA: SDR family NAD(P)-dependent oxidoreductase, partial [Luteibacter sp.]|uniref:SDR family NAD(P)-dependent oxidoreductase n=1 Tax=Luteibacter sp. TaxID=1886636 RepID=UPI002B627B77
MKDIAIIGMSCRFPGAENYARFWENLSSGLSSVGEVPEGRWDRDAFYSRDVREKNKTISKWGGFVDGVEYFDADFFGVSAREAEVMDPQQRIMLEQAWNCFEDAGYDPAVFSGSNTGVYIGVFNFDYRDHLGRELEAIEGHVSTGTHTALIPNRISHFLNLHGPSLPIDTACSSSLVALHKAAHAIRRGECDHALVGGVSVLCSPTHFISFSKTGMLSPDGSCKSFDERANGYVRGEGAAMLLLKPLDKAIGDNDRIVAVVRGTAMNHGGHARTVTYPGSLAQSNVVAEALRQARVPVATVGYVEAHGTGTPKGDPIEVEGLKLAFARVAEERGEVLAEHACGIGSVKTNIGHLESVAGLAGLIKTVLCMKHRMFPPLVHYQKLNPRISFDDSPFFIVDTAQPWPALPGEEGDLPRRAGISSFGFGGVNSHVVVEEHVEPPRVDVDASIGPELIVLSARTMPVLRERARQLLAAMSTPDLRACALGDLAYTLQVGRQGMAVRLAMVVDSFDALRSALEGWVAGASQPEIVFTGEVGLDRVDAAASELAGDDLVAVARRWVVGHGVDWAAHYDAGARRRLALPTYPFVRERHWVERKVGERTTTQAAIHPLVHRNTSTASGLRFSSRFTGAECFLGDHVVHGQATLPAAAQLEMARCAMAHAVVDADYRLKDVLWLRPVTVGVEPKDLHIALFPENDGAFSFELYDETDGDDAVVYGEGSFAAVGSRVPVKPHDLVELRRRCVRSHRAHDACYTLFDRIGLAYGPGHRGLADLFVGEDVAVARLTLPASVMSSSAEYVLHPSIVDAALQATIAFEADTTDAWNDPVAVLPFALGSLDVLAPVTGDTWAVIRRRARHVFDIDLCDEAGTVCAQLGDFVVRASAVASVDEPARKALLRSEWVPQPVAGGDATLHASHLVMLCDSARAFRPDASEVLSALPGANCVVVEPSESLANVYESAANILLAHLQSVGGRPGSHLVQIVVPASGPLSPMAGLAGMLRTARRENPDLLGQIVHVDEGQDVLQALRENRDSPVTEIAYRDGVREVGIWTEWQPPTDSPSPWKARGTYLITGGAGGLGLIVARDIAMRAPGVRLILTGRSALSDAARQSIAGLEALGASLTYRQTDMSDSAAVTALLREIDAGSAGLNGIVHAAGVLRDSFLSRKTPEELRDVFAAKVAGTLHLDEASRDLALDCFICFSSTSGALGNVGQADYAAANAFMDAFARHRATLVGCGERRGRTLSIDWPLWEDGGMQVDAATRRRMAEETGLIPLRSATGCTALGEALASGLPQVLVAEGDIRRFKSSLSPVARPVTEVSTATPAMPSDEFREKAVRYFIRLLSTTLKRPAHSIDARVAMEAYGIDSILVMDLTRALEQVFGPLSKTLLFEYQTIAALAGHFLEQHAGRLAEVLGDTAPDARQETLATEAQPEVAAAVVAHRRPRFGSDSRGPREEPRSRMANKSSDPGDVAIIGVAGRYPQARNLEEFWANLSQGKDSITEIPSERWDYRLYYDEDRAKPGKTYSKWGGFIDGVDRFDPLFFNISPREAELMDPQERLFLECVHATLEDAGYTRDNVADDGNVGVFVGVMYEEYQLYGAQEQARGRHLALLNSSASVANRISYFSNFHGPSMALDTMCSSSLTAIHLACQSLRAGGCEVAIAGGVNVSIHPNKYLMLAQGKFISGKGRCESFGEGGEGYVPGEGVGSVLLKPLAQAIADGDHIYGVIKATAVNHGGKTNGYTVPNPNAQAKVIEQALREGGIDARAVSYIEAHGTGTSLGDPIEIAGLAKAFRHWTPDTRFCAIGSAKSNIGHCESAAGIAGVTKVLLQMKHGQLAPSLHSSVLNPNIDFDGTPFVVQQDLAPWPRPAHGTRIAGISSFGAGGANAHVVIEEYVAPAVSTVARGPALVVLSSRHEDRLREQVQQLLAALASNPEIALADLAYTLQVGREPMEERLALVVDSVAALREKLSAYAAGDTVIDDLYRGQVKKNKDALAALSHDEDMDDIAQAWIAKGKFGKLLDLWVKGLSVDWQRLYAGDRPRRISLPTYPFARERYWVAVAPAAIATSDAAESLHPLLHRNTSDVAGLRFSTRLGGSEFFLADHVVRGERMLPGVAQLEMARQAARLVMGDVDSPLSLRHVAWIRPVTVGADGLELHIALYPEESGEIGFDLYSEEENGDIVTYSQGSVLPVEAIGDDAIPAHDLAALRSQCDAVHLAAASCYALFENLGLHYGPAFQGVGDMYIGADRVLARIALPASAPANGFVLHPSLLDAALQATLGLQVPATKDAAAASVMLPFALGGLEVFAPCTDAMWAFVRPSDGSLPGDAVQRLDVDLCDEQGRVCVRFAGFNLRASAATPVVTPRKPSRAVSPAPLLLEPTWTAAAPSAVADAGYASHAVVLCDVDVVDGDPLPEATWLRPATGPDLAHRFEAAAGALLEHLQSLGSRSGRHLIQVVVPAVGPGQVMRGLGGMLRSAQRENPRIVGQVIAVESGQDIVRLLRENLGDSAHDVRHVGGRREVSAWAERLPPSEAALPWKAHGVYLITGGAGGLGLIFAHEIASQVRHPVLVLTGRSPLDETIKASIRRLETLGAEVRYHAVDVTDAAALGELVRSIPEDFESLDGIIHSAGVVRDSFVARKTRQQLHEVFAAKLAGTVNLDEASREMALDFFICFSSIAGALGNVGQADYAAANAFMDAFVHHRAAQVARGERHGRSLSVNWPLWDEGGMQADAATREMLARQWGMHALATEPGLLALRQSLASGLSQVMVIAGDAARIRETVMGEVRHDAISAPATVSAMHDHPASAQDLPVQVRRALTAMVSSLIKVKPEDIDGDTALSEYGFDSISLTEFSNALNQQYRLALTPTIFFEYPTLDGLSGYLAREHAAVFAVAKGDRIPDRDVVAASPVLTRARMRGAPRTRTRPANEPIAIIGMSGQFPQARDIDAFWQNLLHGKDCIGDMPSARDDWQRWHAERAPDGAADRVTRGGFIDGVDEFDPMFFGISPREAELMDPQQRLMMIHIWKALEDAGYAGPSLAGSDTGIYVGTMPSGYGSLVSRAGTAIEGYSSTGAVASVGPNRMSYYLDFHGPSEPVETACSSSLVALRRAVLAIRRGDCAIAVAGGVNTLVNPELHISFGRAGMLSEDARCKTFSRDANGYVRGEGVAMLVLKPLSAAERDGDPIHGLIRGTAENHGGRANSLTAPNPQAQAAVIRQAHEDAGVDPRTVGYIEAHGTGTPLGDPVEINGLKAAFKQLYAGTAGGDIGAPHCGLGSVKTNIGHLELAAGVAGVVKVLLQMKHGTLVESLHSEHLNPYIDLAGSPFYVVRETREWAVAHDATGRPLPRRAGVSSFGFGGVNAHVVLEEYVPPVPLASAAPANGPVAVLLSARSEERVREQVRELLDFVSPPHAGAHADLTELAYTLQVGREPMEYRIGMTVSSNGELREKLARYLAGDRTIDGLYAGRAGRDKDATDVVATDGAMSHDVGRLIERWVEGHEIPWGDLYAGRKPRRISLPTYPFARERYWVAAANGGLRTTSPAIDRLHPLVQRNTSNLAGPRFSSHFDGSEFVLADHVVRDERVLPGVAQLEMARFAVSEAMGGEAGIRLTDIVWSRPAVVGAGGSDIHVSLHPQDNGDVAYRIHSGSGDDETVHGRGVATPIGALVAPERHDLAELRQRCVRGHVAAEQLYATFAALGLHYGPGFQGIDELFPGDGLSLARVTRPASVASASDAYVLHPSVLDAALQASIGLALDHGSQPPGLMLPFSLGSLEMFAPCTAAMWAVVRPCIDSLENKTSRTVDIDLCDDSGMVCVRMRSLTFRATRAAEAESEPVPGPAAVAAVTGSTDEAADLLERATRYFVRFLSSTLKLPTQRIDPLARMENYGIDSLLVLDLTRSLEKTFGPLPKTLFFEYQTIAALSGYFVQQHATAMAALLGERRAVASTVSVPTATRSASPAYAKKSSQVGQVRAEIGEIAIVGVAGRYPQARNLEEFWANLSQGKDSITEIPSERWDHTLYFDEDRSK